jgi:hypothetical protein
MKIMFKINEIINFIHFQQPPMAFLFLMYDIRHSCRITYTHLPITRQAWPSLSPNKHIIDTFKSPLERFLQNCYMNGGCSGRHSACFHPPEASGENSRLSCTRRVKNESRRSAGVCGASDKICTSPAYVTFFCKFTCSYKYSGAKSTPLPQHNV